MSGLGKFEASKSWRSNLKNFLFIERKPTVHNPVSVGDTQRCSLDISEDLQTLIRERKAQIELEKQTTYEFLPSTSKPSSANMSRLTPHFDDTCFGIQSDLPLVENVSDESFEALERMCDKTASDPNSTLFQYLHSDYKEEVMADAKKRSTGEGNAVGGEDETDLVAKVSECTLLDDIEAPSRIWENTMVGETGLLKTSPVKMVGLLRPSTIIEEAGDESVNSDKSSQMSFQTANKGVLSDVSSTYDTALESTVTSTRTDESSKYCKEEVYVDNILQLAIERTRALDAHSLLFTPVLVSESDRISKTESEKENTTSDKSDISIDLIDLENTFGPLHNSPHLSVLGEIASDVIKVDDEQSDSDGLEDDIVDEESDESIIDISSDVEEETQENLYSYVAEESKNRLKSKCDIFDVENYAIESNKENLTQDSLPGDRSLNFNDTMEEVEYMLKKGMEYMASKDMQSVESPTKCAGVPGAKQLLTKKEPLVNQAKPNYPAKPQPKATIQLRTYRTQPNSPSSSLRNANYGTSSARKVKESYFKTPAKNIQTRSTSEVLTVGMRPFPKFDVFGGRSPKSVAIHPRQKELCRKQPFSHIVSPVGAYMKKTASTPLMSTAKMKNTNTNVMNSTAFRELEIESRLYEAKFDDSSPRKQYASGLSALPGLTGVPNTLPKKAYISSELKHIVDKRTPFTIPGGKKIQKYLENAMMPAVLRHDGKMKFPGAPNMPSTINTNAQLPAEDAQTTSKSPSETTPDINTTLATTSSRRNNASLRDLSLMSGDVSMYTIMDAQKF